MLEYHGGTWSRQADYVRALIDVSRATPPGPDAAGLEAEIRHELERLAGIDADLAAECELEFLDPHAGPAASWGPEWDTDTWEPAGPAGGDDLGLADPADADEATLDLAGWIAAVAARFRALGTDAADLVAETVADLAVTVTVTGATTPAQARDRMAVLAAR